MCISITWMTGIVIWVVVTSSAVALIRLLRTAPGPRLAHFQLIVGVLQIVRWAAASIALFMFAIDLIACIDPAILPRMR